MPSGNFPELVERTRQAANEVCEKAKLVLRPLLPDVEALRNDNAHFSPRLMMVMLARTQDGLSFDDRQRPSDILQHAEMFQPRLTAWMSAAKQHAGTVAPHADARECSRALESMTTHLSELDVLLSKVGSGRRAT